MAAMNQCWYVVLTHMCVTRPKRVNRPRPDGAYMRHWAVS